MPMLQGNTTILFTGKLCAWLMVIICPVYAAVLLMGGVVKGLPREPYFAMAEILTIISAVVLVCLVAAIHLATTPDKKLYSLLGLGWAFVMAAITITVHMVMLTVVRQLNANDRKAYAQLFDFEWPAMLYGIEFVAWHIGLGLSRLFTAVAFQPTGPERYARWGLLTAAILCLAGLAGPATGNLTLRLIGVFGYLVVLPMACVPLARLFSLAQRKA